MPGGVAGDRSDTPAAPMPMCVRQPVSADAMKTDKGHAKLIKLDFDFNEVVEWFIPVGKFIVPSRHKLWCRRPKAILAGDVAGDSCLCSLSVEFLILPSDRSV